MASYTDFDLGGIVCIEQTTSGDFDGTLAGYAILDYSQGGAQLRIRAAKPGTAGNALQIVYLNPGRASATQVRYDDARKLVEVVLAHNGSAITGTVAQTVAAINATRLDQVPVRASIIAAGTMVAVVATNLAGGIDPTAVGGMFRYALGAAKAGLFTFDQTEGWEILSVQAKVTTGNTAIVAIVDIDGGYRAISGTDVALAVDLLSTDTGSVSTSRRCALMPGQAVRVTAVAGGVARVYARRQQKHW